MNTTELFQAIRNEKTDKGKKELLLKQANEFSKWVLKSTFDPSIKYYIKQIPEYIPCTHLSDIEQEHLIKDTLGYILSDKIRGNKCYDIIGKLLNQLDESYSELVVGILTKNLYIAIGPKMLLEVFGKDLFFIPPYMRCKTQEQGLDKIGYPALIQLKADGAFANIIIEPLNHSVTFMTRSGNILDLPILERDILKYCSDNNIKESLVLHGEMMINGASIDNRSEGNGLINKLINKESTIATSTKKIQEAKTDYSRQKLEKELEDRYIEWENIENSAYVECWDVVSYDNWKNGYEPVLYKDRFNKLISLFTKSDMITIIDYKMVDSQQEALEYYESKKAIGLEGAVLKQIQPTKDITTYWKDHTSPGQVKLKGLHVVEMKCIGYSLGDENSPFKNFLGNLICETSDGLFQAKISGLSYRDKGIWTDTEKVSEAVLDEDGNYQLNPMYETLPEFFEEVFKDKIISVQFNDVSISKDKKPSLQFAQYKGVRTDTNNVDTLHYILEMTNKLDKVQL